MWTSRTESLLALYAVPTVFFAAIACLERLTPPAAPWAEPRRPRLTRHLVLLGTMYLSLGAYIFFLLRYCHWSSEPSQAGGRLGAGLALLWSLCLTDLAVYILHRLYHTQPLLWRAHRMHHSDTQMDVSSGARIHPLDILQIFVVSSAVMAVLRSGYRSWQVYTALFGVCAYFQHSNLKLPARWDRVIRWFVITPDMHRVHHSLRAEDRGSNFGFVFTFWDRCFGTYREAGEPGPVPLGMPQYPAELTLRQLLSLPFAGSRAAAAPRPAPKRELV